MTIVFVVLAVFLALAVHEGGHALAGSLRGMRLAMLVVGPLHIQREADGHLRWRLNRMLSLAGGAVSSVPGTTEGLRRAVLAFAAGGPVASVLAGALALATYGLADLGSAAAEDGTLQHALAGSVFIFGAISSGIGFVTLLPVSQGAFVSDGKRILRLLRPGPAAESHAAVAAIGSWMIAGVRPRDWSPGLVAKAVALADGSHEDLSGRHMAWAHALDQGDAAAAGEHIRYLADYAAAARAQYRPVIDLTVAYFDAAYLGDAASARRRLARAGTSPLLAFDPTARTRAEGAVLLAEGDAEGGFRKLVEAYAVLGRARSWDKGFNMAEIRRLCRARGLPHPGADRAR